jgi:hypothetical protein
MMKKMSKMNRGMKAGGPEAMLNQLRGGRF